MKIEVTPKVTIFALGGIFITVLTSGTHSPLFASSMRYAPSLTLSERYDDNVFLVREGTTADFVTLIIPQLRASSTGGEVPRYIQYSAQVERYSRTEGLNTVKHFADLGWTAPITKSATLTLSDRFSFTPDSTEISSVGVAVPRGNAYGNDTVVRLQSPRLDISYGYGLQGFEAAELIDSRSHTFEERAALPLSVRYVITQSYLFRYFIQDGVAALRSHTAGAGLRSHFSPTFSIGAEGGVTYSRTSTDSSYQSSSAYRFDIQNAFRRLKLSLSYLKDIEAQWRGSMEYGFRRGVIRVDYSRDLTAGGGVLVGAASRQITSANLQQAIGRRTSVTLTASHGTNRPISINLNQFESYRGEAVLTYTLRPWMSAAVGYNYFRQDSSGGPGTPEFTRNQGMLSLTATLP